MKYILSLIGSIVVFYIILIIVFLITNSEGLAYTVGILFGFVSFYPILGKFNKKSFKESIADIVFYLRSIKEDINSFVEDKDTPYYAIAEKEINSGIIDEGLWSQALVKARGDENLRKIEYMKLRVKQLKKKR